MTITIYHNPNCGTSRNTLALIREAGYAPQIVEYLKTPLSRAELADLLHKMGRPASELVRRKEALFAELGLEEAGEDVLLEAMAAHPVLMNRPVVVSEKGAALCRPAETVRALL